MGRFSIDSEFTATDRLTGTVARLTGSLDGFSRAAQGQLARVDKVTSKVAGGLSRIGVGLAAGAVVGGTAIASLAGAGMDFESQMARVGAVSLMTRDQVKDLEQKALELGSSTKFSATEVAQGMELMGKAGFTNAEVISGIGPILAAAAAEGVGLEEAAGNISNVLKGMGLQTSEAGRVADVLTLASARTNSSISSLAVSMANVSATAAQFKIPMEEAVAAVALLQDKGLDASVAGSAVNTMLTALAKPAKEVKTQMKALGITFQDSKGNMLPFRDVLGNMSKAAQKAGGNMKVAAFFADLVGLRGQKAATQLQEAFTSGELVGLFDELGKNAKGSAESMAKLSMNTTRGDLTRLSAAVDSVKIALFDTQSGPLRGMIQGMTEWTRANQGLIQSKFVEYITGIKTHFSEIVTWGKRIAIAVAVFYAVAAAVKVAQVAIAAFQIAMGVASFATTTFTAVSQLATVSYYRLAASTAASTVATGLNSAAQWARNAALTIGRIALTQYSLATVWNTVVSGANTAATWLRTAAQTAWNTIAGAGRLILGLFTGATLASTAATVANTVATWARTVAQGAVNVATTIGTAALGAYRIATGQAAASTALANSGMAAFAVTALAAAAAVGAVMLAWDQWKKLEKETGGEGGIGAGFKSLMAGEGFFAGVDKHMNEQARAARNAGGGMAAAGATTAPGNDAAQLAEVQRMAAAAVASLPPTAAGPPPPPGALPQVVSPQDRTAKTIAQTTTTSLTRAEVTIKDQTGTAEVSKKPTGPGFGLRVEHSGAF